MTLTPREWEVWTLMRRRFSNAQIADALGCTTGTVKTHVRSIYRALGCRKVRVWASKGRRLVDLDRARS